MSRDLKECAICGRFFSLERVGAHEVICQKSSTSKRKSFNSKEQRLRGSEAERLAAEISQNQCFKMIESIGPCGLSTNWRGKHEDFVKKIKEFKNQAKEKKKNVKDLPFPPPESDSSDYVQCQYCLRQFNQNSAPRHIAICASRMPDSRADFTND